jgi:hypothetical protein
MNSPCCIKPQKVIDQFPIREHGLGADASGAVFEIVEGYFRN